MNFKDAINKIEKKGTMVFKVTEDNKKIIFILYEESKYLICKARAMYIDENNGRLTTLGTECFLLDEKDNGCYISSLDCPDDFIGKILLDFTEDVVKQHEIFHLSGHFYNDNVKSMYTMAEYEIDEETGNVYKSLKVERNHSYDIKNYKPYFVRYPIANKK